MTQDTNREQEIFDEIISSGDVYNKGLASYLYKLEQIIDASNYKFVGVGQRISKLEGQGGCEFGEPNCPSCKSEPKEEECDCTLFNKDILEQCEKHSLSPSSPEKKEMAVKALLDEYEFLGKLPPISNKTADSIESQRKIIIETLTSAINKK